MNKYQEALNFLNIVNNELVFNQDYNEYSACDDCLGELQELIDKEEKYRWHDLRKDPNDLPPINPKNTHENDVYLYIEYEAFKGIEKRYLMGHLRDRKPYIIKNEKGDNNFWGVPTYETNWLIWDLPVFLKSKVIAWKYIEEFIDE